MAPDSQTYGTLFLLTSHTFDRDLARESRSPGIVTCAECGVQMKIEPGYPVLYRKVVAGYTERPSDRPPYGTISIGEWQEKEIECKSP